jgi:hypothetical protein
MASLSPPAFGPPRSDEPWLPNGDHRLRSIASVADFAVRKAIDCLLEIS